MYNASNYVTASLQVFLEQGVPRAPQTLNRFKLPLSGKAARFKFFELPKSTFPKPSSLRLYSSILEVDMVSVIAHLHSRVARGYFGNLRLTFPDTFEETSLLIARDPVLGPFDLKGKRSQSCSKTRTNLMRKGVNLPLPL